MRVFLSASILGVALLYGCGAAYHIDTRTTDDGVMVTRLQNNQIFVEGGAKFYSAERKRVDDLCTLDIERRRDSRGNVTYFLLLEYTGADALDMEPGRSLTLVIDKRRTLVLSGYGEVVRTKDMSAGRTTESLDYKITATVLRDLATASQVDITISGGNGELRGYFLDNNFMSMRRFLNEYVLTDS